MRTLNEIAQYDFEIRYCPGLENQAADFLSRLQNGQETDADYQIDYKQLPKGLVMIQKTEGVEIHFLSPYGFVSKLLENVMILRTILKIVKK